jgi:hypothetical protein
MAFSFRAMNSNVRVLLQFRTRPPQKIPTVSGVSLSEAEGFIIVICLTSLRRNSVGRVGKNANRECPSAFGTLPCVEKTEEELWESG